MVDKNTLRTVYLEKRLTLSENEYALRNQLLANRIFDTINLSNVKSVHIFLSIDSKKEVLTSPIIEKLKTLNKGVVINISKTLKNGELSNFEFTDASDIKPNKWGIPEPVDGKISNLGAIDIVFVPLISFDKAGHRIGYGKGYYDRFLKKIPKAQKIGLSLSPPLDKILYISNMDVKLDVCITPFKEYNFQNS